MVYRLLIKKNIATFMMVVTQPLSQIIAVFLSLCCVVGLAYFPYITFNPTERRAQLYSIEPQFFKKFQSNPAVVSVGLFVDDFSEFDVVKNKFSFAGIVWFEFDPSIASLEDIDRFSFEQGKVIEKSPPNIQLVNNRLFVRYMIRVDFKTMLDYRLFPLDDHLVSVILINRFISPQQMVFNSGIKNFTLAEATNIGGWQIVDRSVRTGYSTAYLQSDNRQIDLNHPKVVFSMSVKRDGIQGILLIFLPLFLIAFITLFALSFDPEESSRSILSLATSGVASLIGYRFVIQSVSPDIGYFMLSDHIFILFLAFVFAIFAFTLLLINRGKLTDNFIILRGAVFLCFHGIFLGWWYYLLYWWI